jgi:hypothetical protein
MRTTACTAIVIACLAAAGEAAAQNVCELERIHDRATGEGVSADFSSVDTSTCELGIETTVHVDGSQGVIHESDFCGRGGQNLRSVTTTQSNVVAVVVSVYDRCLAMQVLSVTGNGEAEELHVSPSLRTASLRAAFDGMDEFDRTVSIAIDLVWNGVDHKDRTSDHVNFNEGIIRVVVNSSGTIRDAVAAGSVAIGGTDQTPLPSTQGTIEKDAERDLIVYR